jgi:hypothetical protein
VRFICIWKKYINSNWYDDEIYKIRKVRKYTAKFGNSGEDSGTTKMTNKLMLYIFQNISPFRILGP